MGPAERIQFAHRLATAAVAQLQTGNDPASGARLLLRALATDLAAYQGNTAAAEYLVGLAREAFNSSEAA